MSSRREEIAFEAFLAGGDGLAGAAARILGASAGLIWRPVGPTTLRPFGGWSGGALGASEVPLDRREAAVEKGTELPGRAWASGELVADVDRVAIPLPMGNTDGVQIVVEIYGEVEAANRESRDALLRAVADRLGVLLRDARPDPGLDQRLPRHMEEVVRGSQDAVLSKDLEGIVTSWNPAAEQIYGYSAEEAIGAHVSFLVPDDHQNEEMRILERVCRGERLETYETERIRKDGARINVSLTVSPIKSSAGDLIGASVIARDTTAEMRARKAEAFLVAASRRLDASLDPIETARTIVGTAVPELAEICVIDFVLRDGRLGDSIIAGADPQAAARLEEIRRQAPLDAHGEHPAAQVLRSGTAMSWRDLTDPSVIEQVAQSSEHRRLIEDAGYHSAAVVPLMARGRTIGVLSFLHASSDLRYDPDDLAFLSELGDRAALALDNSQLYEERTRIARNLQRGLRPPAPAPVPGLGISVVFEPAGESSEIGGDFYDVLPTEDGCWILIGDVAGKGSAAAGVSVAVRHAVRGLCREIAEPDEILSRVNELLREGNTLNDFATMELIRMRRKRSGWTLKLAAAGHPPAVHVSPAGTRQLGGGSILGAWPSPAIASHELDLGEGESLVLTTDGWFEVGPVSSHRQPACLARMLGEIGSSDLPELTERLRLDAIERAEEELKDDMVILAIRPQAEPAPSESGPRSSD
jgi:PAS domain S-box-containing protein